MPLELTDTGLVIQTLDEIRTELKDAYQDPVTGIDANLDVSDDSLMGRQIGILAQRERSLQEQILAIYNSRGPDATAEALTRMALVTGTVRRAATFATLTAQVNLASSTTLPAGSRAALDGNQNVVFETIADVTSTLAGTYFVTMAALEEGPQVVPIGTLTVISSPETGWIGVANTTAASGGLRAETDPELRLRRITELNKAGSANLDKIVTDVRAVDLVLSVAGYENTSDVTDADGMPPHSYEIVFQGDGADLDAIAQTIWDSGPAGIASISVPAADTETGTAHDVNGAAHVITFSRAVPTDVYSAFTALVDVTIFPVDGLAQLRAAWAAYISTFKVGQDITIGRLYAPLLAVPGVLDIEDLAVGLAPSPTPAGTLDIGKRELAVTIAGYADVNIVPTVP